jgi:hypothetical protein
MLLEAALQAARREAAAMSHESAAACDRRPESKEYIMRSDRACWGMVEGFVQSIIRNILRYRLKIRHDYAHKAIIAQHAPKLRERDAHLMLVKMLDAMRGPDGIGAAIGDWRKIGQVGNDVRLYCRIDIHA